MAIVIMDTNRSDNGDGNNKTHVRLLLQLWILITTKPDGDMSIG